MKITDSSHRLKELLRITGDSQNDMAEKTKIPKSSISHYVNGMREPRQDKLSMIADSYNVNPAWLMGLDVPMESIEDMQKNIIEQQLDLFSKDYSEDMTIEKQFLLNKTVGSYHDLKEALELYDLYENASSDDKKIVDIALKKNKQNP